MTLLTWTLGAGGLLGSRVRAALASGFADAAESRCQGCRFPWTEPARLGEVMMSAAERFVAEVRDREARQWAIAWCAGAGTVGTSSSELAAETAAFRMFLGGLGRALGRAPRPVAGLFFLASSAGGVYAGNPQRPLNEHSAPAPLSPYGEAKLAQETLLAEWAGARAGVSTLVGRIANLYGPGQNLLKQQGLVSLLARAMIQHQPAHIYVPMDTLRDYVFADDCGRLVARCLARLENEAGASGPNHVIKILATEKTTSIGELIGIVKRLGRNHLRLVHAPSPKRSAGQPGDLRFRSVAWADLHLRDATPLAVGIHRLYRELLARHEAGQLSLLSAP